MAELPIKMINPERLVTPSTKFLSQKQETGAERWLILSIFVCLALQFYQVFSLEVNWDEFLYLSRIYDYQSQTLNRALQTFHVYLFIWLPLVGENEVHQVEVGRVVMLVLEAGTAWFIYMAARSFTSRNASLVAALAFVSAGFTMIHGASFRADPIAAFFAMGSIACLARPKLEVYHLVIAAIMMAFAGMITVKIGFYAPALIAICLWQVFRSNRPCRTFVNFILTGLLALGVFAGLYVWHETSLPAADIDGSQTMMSSAAKTTLLGSEFLPTLPDLLVGATKALVPTILFLVGSYMIMLSIWKRRAEWSVILPILGLAAPLLSFLFYRNAYPYFFSFIFPPAMVIVAYAVDQLKLNKHHLIIVSILLVVTATATILSLSDRRQEAQLELIETVHKIFPEPVLFIDRNHMIASFPKRGIFMSTWGLEEYRQAGAPIFDDILKKEAVPLLILNSPTLEDGVGVEISAPLRGMLFKADQQTLRSNYVRHWGKIWVAGKKLSVRSEASEFVIAIPGRYILEAGSSVIIDGKSIAPNQVVTLDRGIHFATSGSDQEIILRWSQAVYRPNFEPSKRSIYRGF